MVEREIYVACSRGGGSVGVSGSVGGGNVEIGNTTRRRTTGGGGKHLYGSRGSGRGCQGVHGHGGGHGHGGCYPRITLEKGDPPIFSCSSTIML